MAAKAAGSSRRGRDARVLWGNKASCRVGSSIGGERILDAPDTDHRFNPRNTSYRLDIQGFPPDGQVQQHVLSAGNPNIIKRLPRHALG